MNTRTGKIARLPDDIREELNRRMRNGELSNTLLPWLNNEPSVRALLAAQFGSRPINAQNLSAWKNGGHGDWLLHRAAVEVTTQIHANAAELRAEIPTPVTDTMATWVVVQYAVAAHGFKKRGELDWLKLRKLCIDISKLRRGDFRAQFLELEKEKHDFKKKRASHKAGSGAYPHPASAPTSSFTPAKH